MDSKVKYNISIVSFFKPCVLPFAITLLFVIVFYPLIVYTYGTDKQLGAWLIAIIWLSITAIPPILLHINYFYRDKRKIIDIDNTNKHLIVTDRGNKQNIRFDEIERIEKYHSKNSGGNAISKIHWSTFYYYKIIVHDKEPIYISRMLIEKLEQKIEGVNFKFIRVPYPLIREK